MPDIQVRSVEGIRWHYKDRLRISSCHELHSIKCSVQSKFLLVILTLTTEILPQVRLFTLKYTSIFEKFKTSLFINQLNSFFLAKNPKNLFKVFMLISLLIK